MLRCQKHLSKYFCVFYHHARHSLCSELYIFIEGAFRLALHCNMNVLLIHMVPLLFSVWAIALLLPGCLGDLQPALHFNQTTVSDNSSSAELRQYTCGSTTTVFVNKGYQVNKLSVRKLSDHEFKRPYF